jgi:hypothetical protein
MKHHPLVKRSIRNAERQERPYGILLLFCLLLVGTFGCHEKPDHTATPTKTNTNLVASTVTNRPCWLPQGYKAPPGKTVIGPIQAQDDCKYGDYVDVLVSGLDPATKAGSSYAIVTNLMVVAGTDAPKDCLPVGTVAIECTPEQRELMQGHGSPPRNWARLHSRVDGNAHEEVRKAPPRGIEILHGTKQQTVYFIDSNGIAVPPPQQEQEK